MVVFACIAAYLALAIGFYTVLAKSATEDKTDAGSLVHLAIVEGGSPAKEDRNAA